MRSQARPRSAPTALASVRRLPSLLAKDAGYAGKETIAQDYRILAVRLLDAGPLLRQLFLPFCTLPTLLG